MNTFHHSTKLRMLWISDIHTHEDYDTTIIYDEFVNNFLDFYQEQCNSKAGLFSYILFTGDIAFMASEKEYKLFWNNFIKGIYEFHDHNKKEYPIILTIPGNHDISWKEDEIFNNFLTTLKSRGNPDKNKFVTDNRQQFYKCFQNYSDRFGKEFNKKDPVWSKLFNLELPQLKVCEEYDRHRLFGYVIDHKNKLVFILINSAWFSIGGKFNELLANLKARGFNKKAPIANTFRDILKEKDSLSEYGTQIIGGSLYNERELHQLLQLSDSYSIFTFCHHNLNWLDPEELYNYNEEVMHRLCLNKILEHSDVLGTGHEHIPVNASIYKVKDGYTHLRIGKFMDDNIKKPPGTPVLENCWLSILELSCAKNIHTITQQKFSYQKNKWHHQITEPISEKLKKGILAEKDAAKVSQKFKELTPHQIAELLNLQAKYNTEGYLAELNGSENYRMFSLPVNDCIRIFVLPLNKDAIKEIFPEIINGHYFLLQHIEQYHKQVKGEIHAVKINLVWSDFFVDQQLTTGYYTLKSNYDELAYEIARQCDFKLQLFLHRLESLPGVKILEQNGICLVFSNCVLPAHYLLGLLNKYMYC
jgi:hypothetical protein